MLLATYRTMINVISRVLLCSLCLTLIVYEENCLIGGAIICYPSQLTQTGQLRVDGSAEAWMPSASASVSRTQSTLNTQCRRGPLKAINFSLPFSFFFLRQTPSLNYMIFK